MTAVVLGVAPIPAYAVSLPCYDTGTFPSERCTVGYQAYPYGQTTGLRSSMQGWPDLGITGTQQAGTDEIRIHLKVWDLNTDGYRARVWIDVFRGCWCTDAVNHVPTTQGAEGGSQGATRVFDSGSSSGNFREWYYTNPDGSVETYLVRLRLGRFQLSTGRYEWGEEQLYRMRVYRL
ncbi:hypothetical protein [Asanoa ishikariensis]|nr:hypothetical protein [Asanoa ishikariensis]